MIMEVIAALEKNDDLLRMLQDAYDYFLVDEHQDTNDAQNRIIELLAGGREHPNLFVVGDEKQAIFRFQGASLENFHYFQERYSRVRLISLRNNYRSTQAILDAAEAVSPREAKLASQHNAAAPPVSLAVLSSPDVGILFYRAEDQRTSGHGNAGRGDRRALSR